MRLLPTMITSGDDDGGENGDSDNDSRDGRINVDGDNDSPYY